MSIKNQKGLTLIELMIVVVIIGILAAIAIPRFSVSGVKSRQSEAKQLLKQVFTLENAYRQEYDAYTSNTLSLGFSAPSNCRYAYVISLTSPTYFMATASSQTNLDRDDDGDIWYIDTTGKPIVISDDANTQF